MELSALAGNTRWKELLSRQEEGRGLSHAYILSGPAGSGRHTLARLLTAAMVCTAQPGKRPCGSCPQCKKAAAGIHPDRVVITGLEEGKPINVNQIRDLQREAHIRPNEAERKIYWLEEADRMNDSAQNAMLKLLEDGPKYAVFLLITHNAGGMLQTIRSRCVEITMSPVSLEESEQWLKGRFPDRSGEEIHSAALQGQGYLGRAVELLEAEGAASRADLPVVRELADAMEQGSELELFELTMTIEKYSRSEFDRLLNGLEEELIGRMVQSRDRRRLLKGVELVKQLKTALQFNTNTSQLAGWLCAGLFVPVE